MKIIKKLSLGLSVLLILVLAGGHFYLNSGSKSPDNSVWTAFIGRDTTVGILPDTYANYYTYALVRTSKNTAFKVSGEFPDTRYMSFNVYSLHDNTSQGSLVDYQITPDNGLPNRFLADESQVQTGERFTTYIVPERYQELELDNKLVFKDDVRFLLMVIRLYDFNVDDFGGVEYPTVQALSFESDGEQQFEAPVSLPRPLDLRAIVQRVSLPGMVARLGELYETEAKAPLEQSLMSNEYQSIPFHAVDDSGYIANHDNRYLMAAVTQRSEEVYVISFKSPSYTTGPENINQTDVRYWSFNLGNSATYNFNGLKDEDALIDQDGFVTIVLAAKDEAIERQAKALGYNFMEWNMPSKEGLILFRHMLANPNFEAQIDSVPPFDKELEDFAAVEAYKFMGDYAPRGIRLSKAEFLSEAARAQHTDSNG